MAKTEETVPRRRGRPHVDRQAQINEVLPLWIERGGAGWAGLRRAVNILIPPGPPNANGNFPHNNQREALYDALRDLGYGERIERAVRLA